jgi:hypothetical protein
MISRRPSCSGQAFQFRNASCFFADSFHLSLKPIVRNLFPVSIITLNCTIRVYTIAFQIVSPLTDRRLETTVMCDKEIFDFKNLFGLAIYTIAFPIAVRQAIVNETCEAYI